MRALQAWIMKWRAVPGPMPTLDKIRYQDFQDALAAMEFTGSYTVHCHQGRPTAVTVAHVVTFQLTRLDSAC